MYYQKRYYRWLAMLLAVCMVLTLNGGFAFAADEGADGAEAAIGTSSVDGGSSEETGEPQTPPDGEQGDLSDSSESDSVLPGEDVKCTCPPVDSGEVVHGEGCPLYTAPEKPAAPEAPIDPLAAVYALIDALPTMAELEAVDTEGADFPAYLEKLQADAAAARAAYDALTPEEREAFDPARLQKLTDIEGLFGVSTMALAVDDTFTAKAKLNGADIDCTFMVLTDSAVQVGEDAVSAASAIAKTSAGALVIPSTVSDGTNTYTVTTIGQTAFMSCTKLTDVTIPNSVTAIGKTTGEYQTGAFYQCTSLKSINIPDGVTTLGYFAFSECPLTTVSLPDSVTEMGPGVFARCLQLESVNIPTGVNTINTSTFFQCVSLKSIHIPNNVTSISSEPFAHCKALTSITIPDSVTSIGTNAFVKCTSLTRINIPSGVTSIGREAFYGCSSLTSITIPALVTSIDHHTFNGCAALTTAKFEQAAAPTMGASVFANVAPGFKILIPHSGASGYLTENTTNGWAANGYAPKIVTVTGVTVAPDAQMVIPGGTQQFTATVAGNNSPLQTVTWAISGQSSASTTISTDGLLTVAADETATTLTVTATSSTTEAPSKNASVTVTLGKATPGMTLAPSSASVTYGTPVTLTATVTGAGNTPTGTVVFKDGDKVLDTVTMSGGVATYSYNIPVTHGTLTAEYSGDSGYKPETATSAAVTVTPKPLTVTAQPKTITYGDAKPTDFTANYSGFVYGETSSVLGGTLTFACAYNQFDDAKGYDITPGGLTSSNYAITFAKGTLTVNQKELTLTWSGTSAREYDGTASSVTATATGMVNGNAVPVAVSGGNLSAVGTHTATASISAANYKLPAANTTNYIINPRTITMTLNDPTSFEYDGNLKTVTAKVTNIVGSEDITVTLSGDKQTNKGDYTATAAFLVGANAGNYHIGTPAPTAAWKITGKVFPFEVTPPTASGITYGQPLSASTLTGDNSGASVRFSLFALIDSRGVDKTGTFAWKDGTQVLSSGTQTAVAVFTPTDTNYSPVDCNVTIAVAKKDVTVSVSGTKAYGAQPIGQNAFTVIPAGMVNGETDVSLLGTLALTSNGNKQAAMVGSYDISVAQSGESNYKVTTTSVANGFTVTNATITGITVTPYDGIYDGVEYPRATVTGTQPGDTVTYSTDGISFSGTAPTVQAVTADAPVYVKVSRANHDDFTSENFIAQVEPREIAVAFTLPANLVYDSKDKTVTAAITNKCGTDDVSLTLGNATGKAVGKYTTTVTGLSGAAAGNYNLPSPAPEQKWEITGTPYPHEIVLPTASGITYGKALSESTLTGNNGGTGSFAWNDGAILPPSGSYTATVVFTPTDTNFAPVTRTVQVAVAKADVTLEVSGTKAYHTPPIANADFVVSNITGMVNGETDVSLLGTLTLTSDGNKQAAIVGSYDISVAQSGESNYTVTTKTVTDGFTVTRAAQTLSGTASYTKLLTDKDFALDIITDSTDTDEAVTYTLTNDGGGAVTLDADGKTVRMKKPGTATITANAAQTANFSAAAPLPITVTVGSNPAVRALATEDITTTGAKIGGVVTAGTIATTGYGLEYKKASDADYTPVSADETANGNVKTLTYALVGLEKNTEYAVRVWAKTADKTFESVSRFRTAAEQPPTGKVEGEITDNSGTNTAITVTIEAGNTVIASHTVKAGGGTFTFEALPNGFYNLVADNGKYKVTRMVEIVKGGAVTNVQMEIGRTQSVVEIVTPDTPNVAVNGLPELFENAGLYTSADQDLVENNGGTVEFKLLVEKKDTPADAEEIEKIAEGKVGVYLDIGLLKTVTDQNGREQESELVPDLGANEITIVIPLPKELQGKQSYTVYRVHNGTAEKLDSTHNADGNTLTIQSSLFSTYAIAYTEKSGGTGGGSGGSSSDDGYDFWMTVKDKIQKADDGDVVKVNAKGYDKMPWSVMDALYKNDGVSLVITWNGKTITIPAGKAQKNEPGRIYWPLSLLAELYADIMEDTVLTPAPQNPETGGPGKYIPVTGGDLYEMTAPMAEQVTQPAAPGNAGAIAPITPAVITPPDAGFEPDTFVGTPDAEAVKTNSPILWVVIAGMLTAAAVACGVWFWKRKEREQA